MEADGGARSGGQSHVVFLGHGGERTGPPILLGHLLRGLAARGGYRTSVLVARGGPLVSEYEATGATVESLGGRREPWEPAAAALRRAGLGRTAGRAQQAWRRRVAGRLDDADIVYVNAATPPTAALLRALDPPPRTPVILHVHELGVGLNRTLDPADLRYLFDRADHIVAASGAVERHLVAEHGIAPERLTTCPEFVDIAALRPGPREEVRADLAIPAGAAVVGSVGLPDWRKAPELLLHAVTDLRRKHPELDPWVLWVGGDPGSVDGIHLADEAARVGLADRLVHVAHVERPDRLLGAMDAFALPAREDALPLAALEAAACGLPLVCFRAGGIADLCDAGAGTAVAYPDTAAFADALADLLTDPGRREQVGSAAAELVRTSHDVGVGVERIDAVLQRVLAGRAR